MFEDFDLKNDMDSKFVAKIKVIGVGGAGNNAVNRMIDDNIEGIDFIVANTDKQVLTASKAKKKIVLGESTTKGLGAGAEPEVGMKAAQETEEEIKSLVSGADLVFVAAGMGGGTGTGAAPIIAQIARKEGALVVGIVTTPFKFEGMKRMQNASEGLKHFYDAVDSIIIVSNDRLLMELGSIPLKDSFKYSDAVLKQAVRTITDLIAMPALINLDFADVRTVMKEKGPALIGIGSAKGENKAVDAAINAINSPILEASIDGAKNAIINITGGTEFTIQDANIVVDTIKDAAQSDTNIIFGVSINEELEDELVVSVIATELDGKLRPKSVNQEKNFVGSSTRDKAYAQSVDINSYRNRINEKKEVPAPDETLNIEADFGFNASENKKSILDFSNDTEETDISGFVK